ncbi:DUF3011 domain-containing protein [Pseudoxanthomonas putridarboris]|uniref:DUF3011 domain-containing protein n=1 Tax=Pseudoxanthomonas putridarboris TaxID=752605 RepID=A0ABU9J677_9GAMM
MSRQMVFSLMLGALAIMGMRSAQAAPQYGHAGYGGDVVRCESKDGRYRQCAIDTRGGVQLTRQLSSSRCVQGRSWGYDRGGIWVNHGCRAEFRSGYGGGGSIGGQRIRCESDNGRTRTCAVPSRGEVRLVRQLSSARCTEGHSWGRQRDAIWVSRGCRAEFEVAGRGGQWGGGGWNDGGYGQTFRCESDNGRNRHCRADARRGIALVRQLSSSPCIEGRTWGRDRGGVWVDRGCRAEFRSW